MTEREGYAVSSLAQMGDSYGFRKIRRELDVTAFGINALVIPPGYETGVHYHDEQEETYFVHEGRSSFASATARGTCWDRAASYASTRTCNAACATSGRPTRS